MSAYGVSGPGPTNDGDNDDQGPEAPAAADAVKVYRPDPLAVLLGGPPPPRKLTDTQYTNSSCYHPITVEGSAVGKTDQYADDRQRLVGSITTKGAPDMAKGTRGNSKQANTLGSTKGRPGGPVAQSERPGGSGRRGAPAPQGPGGHPNQKATMAGANVRGRAPK